MMKKLLAALCVCLLLNATLGLAAVPPALGKLASKGAAEVNGALAPAETTLFAGDRIVTRSNRTAMVSLTGGSQLILVGASAMQIQNGEKHPMVSLSRGELAVLSRSALPVAVDVQGVRIHAAGPEAVYSVTVNGLSLKVVANKGAAEVFTGDRTLTIAEGSFLEASLVPPQDPRGAGKPPRGAKPAGNPNRLRDILIVSAVAVAVVGTVLLVHELTDCHPAPSPSTTVCN